MKQRDVTYTLEDLLAHFADEFRYTTDTLKKFRDIPKYECFDSNSEPIKMNSIEDLKKFLQDELNAYQLAIDEL